MNDPKLPLGRKTGYPDTYRPAVLFALPRSDSRRFLDIGKDMDKDNGELPFHGTDIWNAWDLTWLGPGNLPVVATAEIRVPASSPKLIESKSLKLYLGSFAMSKFESAALVADTITRDLTACLATTVEVHIAPVTDTEAKNVSCLPGTCLDAMAVICSSRDVDAGLLKSDPASEVQEELHSHLLRSLCPVTAQPDIGSLAIHYRGPKIDRAALLQYIVSYRRHNDFHEACVERMFVDILERCKPQKLSIYACYQRRGGIDINPFRSNFEEQARNIRLWRQ